MPRQHARIATFLTFAVWMVHGAPTLAQQQTAQAPAAPQGADTIRAGRFDNGKMWTFEYPPIEYLRETYGFSPDTAWFRKARLGSLRIPSCSASLVSARGLVMTNHHCGRDASTAVTKPGENLLDNGFYARTEAEERKADEMHADQLIAIVDVTAEMDRAEGGATDPAAIQEARERASEAARERITQEHGGEAKGIVVEVTSLWNGARTSAYVFRRYDDVRLVMAPELQMGYFGGDPDNFTYPRYALDMTFFRIYDANGQPLATPEHFAFSTEGVKEDDVVFVVGNPGSTSRLQTVAELEYRRDVQDVALLGVLDSRVAVLQKYIDENPDTPEPVRNELFSLMNSQKAYAGIVRGLKDPDILARRRDGEAKFAAAIEANAQLKTDYGDLIAPLAQLQQRKRDVAAETRAFIGLGNASLDGSALVRGLYAGQYVQAKAGGAPADVLEDIKNSVLSQPAQPPDLQEVLIASRLNDVQNALGAGNGQMQAILEGRSPEGAAAVVVQQSPLADSAKAAQALESGSLTLNDPAIKLARALIMRYAPFQSAMQPIAQEEEELARKLGRARFEVYGVEVPPDATFSLRIADGVVKRYEYNGTIAPTHTTFYGLFDRYHSFGEKDWALPKRWVDREAELKLETPMNFISTADIIGGNSGSPVLDKELRVVGLVFDGNIESLPGEFIYLDDVARTVAVDARGIVEALRAVYQADRLVNELTGAPAPARR
jgi:hypothetical protein